MASTFLTRLRVDDKIVDAKGVSRLYQSRISAKAIIPLVLAAAVTILGRHGVVLPAGQVFFRVPRHAAGELLVLADWTLLVIDFRYHLVSIVAVFLALAIGIVVGATALKPKTEDFFDRASRLEEQQIKSQQAKNRGLQSQVGSDQAFAKSAAPLLLGNLLTDQRVVLVTAPGADGGTINGVTAALKLAGAKVIGQAQLQPAFFDTSASTQNSLDMLAQKVAPPTVILGSQPTQPPPTPRSPASRTPPRCSPPPWSPRAVPTCPAPRPAPYSDGFAAQGYLQLNPATLVPAAGDPRRGGHPVDPPAGDSDPANLALLSLAEELALNSRGVVVGGPEPGSGSGSAIDEMVSGGTGIQLSSVDNANPGPARSSSPRPSRVARPAEAAKAYGIDTGAVPTPAPTRPRPTLTAPAATGRNDRTPGPRRSRADSPPARGPARPCWSAAWPRSRRGRVRRAGPHPPGGRPPGRGPIIAGEP